MHSNPNQRPRKHVEFSSSWLGDTVLDRDWLAGRERLSWVTPAGGGDVLSRSGRSYGWRNTNEGFGDAWQVDVTDEFTQGQGHRTRTRYFYDDHVWARRLQYTRDLGKVNAEWANIEGPDGRHDHRCHRLNYTPSTDRFITGLVHRERTFWSFDCRSGTAVSDERSYYDGQAPGEVANPPAPAAPSRGNVSHKWRATGGGVIEIDDDARASVVTRTSYETGGFADVPGWGRPVTMTDERGTTTTIDYESFSGLGIRQAGENHATKKITTTNALGHTASSRFDIFGRDFRSIDPSGRVTTACFDPLGRVRAVYLPGMQSNDCNNAAQVRYAYLHEAVTPQHSDNVPVSTVRRWRVRTRTLFSLKTDSFHPAGGPDGPHYLDKWEYVDGNGRVIQTQEPSPVGGTILTRTKYDSVGAVRQSSAPYRRDVPPGEALRFNPDVGIRHDTLTRFDPLGRPTLERVEIYGNPRRKSTTSYDGATATTWPMTPAGEGSQYAPTVTSRDAHGRTWRVEERGAVTNPGGTNGHATTRYEYNERDELVKIIDNTGVETTMDYNWLGWRTRLDDPNQGATTTRYLPNGVERWSRDARGVRIWSKYDTMSRLTGEYRGWIAADRKLADYTYDGLSDAVGELTRTRSYQPAGELAAIERLEAVDNAGRPAETSVEVPAASDPAIRGPYTFTTRYTRNGATRKRRLPGVASSNLPDDEVLTHTYGMQGV